jgi:hypothetical protein
MKDFVSAGYCHRVKFCSEGTSFDDVPFQSV